MRRDYVRLERRRSGEAPARTRRQSHSQPITADPGLSVQLPADATLTAAATPASSRQKQLTSARFHSLVSRPQRRERCPTAPGRRWRGIEQATFDQSPRTAEP